MWGHRYRSNREREVYIYIFVFLFELITKKVKDVVLIVGIVSPPPEAGAKAQKNLQISSSFLTKDPIIFRSNSWEK